MILEIEGLKEYVKAHNNVLRAYSTNYSIQDTHIIGACMHVL